ncbi:MAG: hypothetical protein DIZ80_05695 [endosymbiont of Galathealinum brachiosum]|uniref:Uncharacterized protein n=1 Tax=endosymbiont of Galathealinum brachiosum TaxID=2200906 RepID=A0A370DLB9_9GAMM|nr:MAG: hypothetical protein DIZ80_05695 [endosymbiont of Galathealinum brachiosum]
MKKVLLFIIVSQLIACSSDYSPNEKMLAFKKEMTVDQAKEILQKRVWAGKESQGICGSRGFWYDENSDMLVHDDKIYMLAHERGRQLKKQIQNFDDIVVFEKQYYEYDFKFNSISNVFIYDDPLLLPYFPGCNKKELNKGYFIIDLFKDKLTNLKFITRSGDFDKTMAALAILMPEKKVVLK